VSGTHGTNRAGARHRPRLWFVFGMVLALMVAEIITGFATHSLALISDAGHMATDALGLGMALAAIVAADKADHDGQHTFGLYRLEVLAALANAALLVLVAGYVIVEAANRIREPHEILSGPMLAVAVLGLLVNIVSWRLLREGAAESINVEGAFLEVVADLAGSVAVIVAAVLIMLTGWPYVDSIFGAGIGLFILPRAWRLGGRAIRILVQAAPAGLDLGELRRRLAAIPGVGGVHDLHIWTLTSEMNVGTVHLIMAPDADIHLVIDRATDLLRDGYQIAHAAVQVEPEAHQECAEVTW
jgi:cobalt-zinc-cadmium efflux system protein